MSIFQFWTCNGSPDFGLIPAGILECSAPTPIRLQRGDNTFGEVHIQAKHGHWIQKHASSVPELAWMRATSFLAETFTAIARGPQVLVPA